MPGAYIINRNNFIETEGKRVRFSRKAVVRLCAFCAVVVAFSAAAFFPSVISAAVTADSTGRDEGLQYKQSCDVCLPPDNEKSGSNSEIFEHRVSSADLIRANTGLPASGGTVSDFDYLTYTVRFADTAALGHTPGCDTVMRC